MRATSISRLLNSGVDPVIVAQHSGHKDPNSIRHYATADLEAQRYMGSVLARPDMRAHGILPAPQPAALPEPTAVPGPSLALTQTTHNADPEATRSATSKCRAPPTTPAGVMSGLSNLRVAGRRPVSAALGRAPGPPPEDTVGQDQVSLFIQYFGKYFINASVHGKYCSARCLMTFSFHCIACSMNVRSMFVKFSVCLQGVFDLNLDVPRSRLSLRRPAAAHTSGAEAQPKVRQTEAPRAAPAPTAAAPQPAPTTVAAELAPPALAVNAHAHLPRPDGLQDPPAAAPLPAAPLPAAPLPAAPLPAALLPVDPLPAAPLPVAPLPADPLPVPPPQNVALPHPPQEVDLPVDEDDDDVIIPASQMSAAGAAFAAQIFNSVQQVMGNMFRGAVIHNPRYEFHFHFNK